MKKWLLIALLIMLMIPVGLFGLVSSEAGSRWLLQQVFSRLPAQVTAAKIEGRLIDRLVLKDLHYQSDTETVAVKNLVFSWRPRELLSGTVKIIDLTLNGVTVTIRKAEKLKDEAPFDFRAELRLPVEIEVENLLLTDARLQSGEQVYELARLRLAATTEQGTLSVSLLEVNAKPVVATVQGQVTLGKGFPFSLQADWQVSTETNGVWQGASIVHGNIDKIVFDNRLSTPFAANLTGNLEDAFGKPRVNAHGDWRNLKWPLTAAEPQLKSEQGTFELSGLLDDYRLTVNSRLTQQYLPESNLAFKGTGSLEAMAIEKLELKSKTGLFLLAGDVSWKEALAFDLTAQGQHFNPAIILPEMPGDLTFSTRIKGKLAEQALQLEANIDKLTGKLRNYPVSADGKLSLAGDQLTVDSLRINSGTNRLAVDGTLGKEQGALDVTIDAPKLDTLWPGLGGSLKGEGRLKGAWRQPTVEFQAQGRRLSFAGYSAAELNADIGYHPEATSRLSLSVTAIKSGTIEITRLRVEGSGTQAAHSFSADLRSNKGDLSTLLTGGIKNGRWQGSLSQLALNVPNQGRWQLREPMAMTVAPREAGVDLAFEQGCLARQAASVCVQGRYQASGDFQAELRASALPLALLQTYLTEQVTLSGILNADAQLARRKGVLAGRYSLQMPAGARVLLQGREAVTTIPLGASSVTGAVSGNAVSADLDLALAGRDFVRGQLQADIGPSQAVDGRIQASVAEFSLFNALVPDKVSGLKGQLQADLTLYGALQKPAAAGTVRLSGGAVDIQELGLRLRDINLEIAAARDNAERLRIQGSAKSGAGSVYLDGFVLLQPEAGWPLELTLTGDDFEVAKLPEAQIAVSPALKIAYANGQGKVTGKLGVPMAIMKLKQLPEQAVKVSEDEIIVGEEPVEKTAPAVPGFDIDVDVELGKNVKFSGMGLKTDLAGKLKIVQRAGKMTMHGTVDMKEARYEQYGQDLTVRKGRFAFNGPVDNPWLDVEAVRVSNDKKVTAVLSVTGLSKTPRTRIYSEPALPEAEALAYLITGRPLNQASESEGNMIAGAALSYGAGKVSWLASKFGADQFEVKEGKTLQDTLLAVGRHLTPEFYIGTKVGLFNKQAVLVLRRMLTEALSVETEAGTSQRIKLNYQIETD
ncbi:translocation/assembly module TamB domain-containing protein [Methylobacter sp. YRD-M1]|uniref:translocation/assembly module TamB domain-containing protein n=1 Tax=Methylobacter sp. YRD-M1 TaxID=2911520 RepID=UPI00227A8AF6|nr:translocation/assembly module TamB domain-containing protein [Methylobacter sp. YRD-M1]WAK01070.1 translocation/assembly module TamB domain-containing protein [Methylobacter sp. YRD-M1]